MVTIIVVNTRTSKAYSLGPYRNEAEAEEALETVLEAVRDDPLISADVTPFLSVQEYLAVDGIGVPQL